MIINNYTHARTYAHKHTVELGSIVMKGTILCRYKPVTMEACNVMDNSEKLIGNTDAINEVLHKPMSL
jgi:hypothetical protein